MFQFLLLGLGKERRGDTPRHSILCTHPHDSARVTQMAQSTGRNRSVPNGPAAPSPRCPSLGPTMRPCAAPAARPGIWRRDRGNSRQIFKTEPRKQSRPLCAEEAASRGPAPRGGRPGRMRAARRPRSGDPELSAPGRRACVNPFPAGSPGPADEKRACICWPCNMFNRKKAVFFFPGC